MTSTYGFPHNRQNKWIASSSFSMEVTIRYYSTLNTHRTFIGTKRQVTKCRAKIIDWNKNNNNFSHFLFECNGWSYHILKPVPAILPLLIWNSIRRTFEEINSKANENMKFQVCRYGVNSTYMKRGHNPIFDFGRSIWIHCSWELQGELERSCPSINYIWMQCSSNRK